MFVIEVVNTVPQTVQRHGVYSPVYDTMHYREPLKSFNDFLRAIAMIVQKTT